MKTEQFLVNGMEVNLEEYSSVVTALHENEQSYTITIVSTPTFKIYHAIAQAQ